MAENLTPEELKEIRRTFNLLDKNSDEKLSKTEIEKGMHLLKVHPTLTELEQIMDALDSDGNGLVTWEEYLKVMSKELKKQSYEEHLFMDAFKKFDKDGGGFIDKDELKLMLKKKGDNKWTDEDIAFLDDLFEEADANKDGMVDYKEFVKAFCEL